MKWLKNIEEKLQVGYEGFLYFWGLLLVSCRSVTRRRFDSRGVGRMMIIGDILGLILSIYVAGATLADAITNLTNSTKWINTPAAVQTLGTTVLGMVCIVVFIFMLIKAAGLTGD